MEFFTLENGRFDFPSKGARSISEPYSTPTVTDEVPWSEGVTEYNTRNNETYTHLLGADNEKRFKARWHGAFSGPTPPTIPTEPADEIENLIAHTQIQTTARYTPPLRDTQKLQLSTSVRDRARPGCRTAICYPNATTEAKGPREWKRNALKKLVESITRQIANGSTIDIRKLRKKAWQGLNLSFLTNEHDVLAVFKVRDNENDYWSLLQNSLRSGRGIGRWLTEIGATGVVGGVGSRFG